MQEMLVQFLVWEDPLEKEMAIPSSIVTWGIQWSVVDYSSMVLQRVRHNLATEQQQQQHVLDTVLYK